MVILIADRIVIVLSAHEIKCFTDFLLFYTLRAPLKKLFPQILAQMADKLVPFSVLSFRLIKLELLSVIASSDGWCRCCRCAKFQKVVNRNSSYATLSGTDEDTTRFLLLCRFCCRLRSALIKLEKKIILINSTTTTTTATKICGIWFLLWHFPLFLNVDNKIKLRFQKMTFACWRLAIFLFRSSTNTGDVVVFEMQKVGQSTNKKKLNTNRSCCFLCFFNRCSSDDMSSQLLAKLAFHQLFMNKQPCLLVRVMMIICLFSLRFIRRRCGVYRSAVVNFDLERCNSEN
ncbi:hypothetical protein T07_12183 [Trichinella nelsoni]|uniref:Uncharacterized protein n=1 Tax=Trichinella nelsoni TaxID=6336 RepID=A0A0V0RR29_9BILA|nr:hypothetical protein T07_12183 [Trichinella nelsoni]